MGKEKELTDDEKKKLQANAKKLIKQLSSSLDKCDSEVDKLGDD